MLFAVLLFVLVTMVAIFLLVIKCCMERVKRDIDCKQHETYSGDTDPNETYVYEYSQLYVAQNFMLNLINIFFLYKKKKCFNLFGVN